MQDDAALLEGFKAGHSDAVGEVITLVARVVRFHGFGLTAQDQSDLVQETLKGLLGAIRLDGFRVRESFAGFAVEVAMRRCIDHRRKRRPALEGLVEELVDRGKGPEDRLLESERSSLAGRILCELPDTQRRVIYMRLHEDLGYREIALREGKSEEAVRRAWSDGLKRATEIRRRLEREELEKGERRK